MVAWHRPRPGPRNERGREREFRGLRPRCRSEDRRSWALTGRTGQRSQGFLCQAGTGDGSFAPRWGGRLVALHRPRPGPRNERGREREFRGLWPRCRSEDRRSWTPTGRTGQRFQGFCCARRGLATGVSLPGGEAVWWRGTVPARVHATRVDESGSFAACGRDAGLKTGAPGPPPGGLASVPRVFCARRGLATGVSLPGGEAVWWRGTVPARVHAMSVDESGSFAAGGRDAGLKTGAPGPPPGGLASVPRVFCARRGLATGVSLPGGEAVWWRGTVPARVHAMSVDESGSFAAYGRDAGLKTGAPGPPPGGLASVPRVSAPGRDWRREFRSPAGRPFGCVAPSPPGSTQ